jgi:methylated-DNA-[protein]-cysteine S-methyltransferase
MADQRRVRLNIVGEDTGHPLLRDTERQLREYFAGQRTAFDLKLDFAGTAFQNKVWQALLTIPFGETRSYTQIAQQIGHRVIGSAGALTGFAGGLEAKAFLLRLEQTLPPR